MCLAIPMRIVDTDGVSARVEVEGTSTDANVSLIENPSVGDYVIIHAGFAIEKLDEKEAKNRIALFDELGMTESALLS